MSFYNHPFEFSKHNFFRAAHLSYTMPKYWESSNQQYNRLSKYRTSTGNSVRGNGAAIRQLQRKVAALKPEAQQLSLANNTSYVTGTYQQNRIDVSAFLAATADRDQRITGDSWKNQFLKFRIQGIEAGMQGIMRVVILRPKKAGVTYSIAEGAMLDPNQVTVFYDQTTNFFAPDRTVMIGKANLKNLKSTFIGTTPETGDIQMYLLYRNTNTSNDFIRVDWQLQYTDM